MKPKHVHLLGATGSIGTQTLDIIRHYPDDFRLITCSFHSNIKKGIEIIKEFKPYYVSVGTSEMAKIIKEQFPEIDVHYGIESLTRAATYECVDGIEPIVVTAVVGSVGLIPTVEAIKKGYNIALANKETLVTAGHLVMELARQHQVSIIPVDSEHSAIFQSLNGEDEKAINKLIITASGGSFRDLSRDELAHVTLQDALNHPNWSMGKKITIDSATMMNKGLEVIEAHWLFNLGYDEIETILHKESVIHSMVEFVDTSVIAQLGTPDMRMPIQYALTYPKRIPLQNSEQLNLGKIKNLHFKEMDFERFPMLQYAYEAGRIGGSLPTVLNASNEAAVQLFLNNQISFLDIEKMVYNELDKHKLILNPNLETVLQIDQDIKNTILNKD